MCIIDALDSLAGTEQALLQRQTATRLPGYRPSIQSNEHFTWAVLEPERADALPRFTVCRIAPCIMVMVEDAANLRRFASMASVEDAIAFARRTVEDYALALRNVHRAPELAQ